MADRNREAIIEKVRAYDEDSGPGAVLRENGIPFIRRGHIEDSAKIMLYGIENGPEKQSKFKKSVDTIANLDKWAATQQHLICGLPFDEPVRDPEWIKANYLICGGKLGKVNYPHDAIIEKLSDATRHQEPNAAESRKKSRAISKI